MATGAGGEHCEGVDGVEANEVVQPCTINLRRVEQALQVIKEHQPDLIILDILMPLLDGFRTARILKFDKRYKDIPIIVLTSRATNGERKIGEQVGADEYLYKPFRPLQVTNLVQRYLNA